MLVDGEPLDGARLEALRRETAWVDPAVQLWNRSLLDNLRYGAAEGRGLPLDQAIDAADLVAVLRSCRTGCRRRSARAAAWSRAARGSACGWGGRCCAPARAW